MNAPLTAGSVVADRYRVQATIGEGGHGVVYRADDMSIGRAVALKMLHAGGSSAAMLEARFEREARLARELQHPNTVRLLEFGRTRDGKRFIAYELLDGLAMDQALKAGPMPSQRVATIGAQLLKSLMEAHDRGVVHRDIKPANIFLCNFAGAPDFVKVLDFGIAKSDDGGGKLTQTGFVIGTPSYMAPEQMRGDAVGPATDVYAVGLVLAEALAGHVIVQGSTDAVIAAAQLSNVPVSLPAAVLQSPLGPVIHRATQKDLSRRYGSAAQMLEDIQAVAHLSSQRPAVDTVVAATPTAVVAVPTNVHAQAGRPTPRGKAKSANSGLFVGCLAGGALMLALGVGGALWFAATRTANTDSSEASDGPQQKRKRKRQKSDRTSARVGDLATLTLDELKSRVPASNLVVTGTSKMPVEEEIFVVGVGPPVSGRNPLIPTESVSFARNVAAAERLEAMMSNRQGYAVRRHEDRALAASGATTEDADRLLDELLGLRKPTTAPPPKAEPSAAPAEPEPSVAPVDEPAEAPKPAPPVPTPRPTPRPAPTTIPRSPTPRPRPAPTNPCNCPPGDLMCNMRCSQ